MPLSVETQAMLDNALLAESKRNEASAALDAAYANVKQAQLALDAASKKYVLSLDEASQASADALTAITGELHK